MRKTPKSTMRWAFVAVLLLVMALGLAACGTDEDTNDSGDTVDLTEVASAPDGADSPEDADDTAVDQEGEASEELEDAGNELEQAGEDLEDAGEELGDAAQDAAEDAADTDIDLPDIDVPDVDVPDVDLPDVDLEVPDVDLPDVDLEAPDIDLPDVDLPEADIDPGDLDVDAELPEIDPGDLDVDVDLPDIDPGSSDIDIDLPEVDIDVEPGSVDVDSEAPEVVDPGDIDVDAEAPEVVDPGSLDVDAEAPSVDLPDVDVDPGDIDVDADLPEADVELPEVDVDVDVDTEPGSVDVEDEGSLDVDIEPGSVEITDANAGDAADISGDFDIDLTPFEENRYFEVDDQFVADGQITISAVTADDPAWVVVHADDDGEPGDVLGYTRVEAGTTEDVVIDLENTDDVTRSLWLMLHEDSGEADVYEFGEVDDADLPVLVDDAPVVARFWTGAHIRVQPQILLHADNTPDTASMDENATMTVASVLSEGPGWLVIHADDDGSAGSVLGYAPVADGLNQDVQIELDADALTPTVWPMLHEDSGEIDVYEFGEVDDADLPVTVDDEPLVFPVSVAPAVASRGHWQDDDTLVVDWALIDAAGWLVIHRDNDGEPGDVLGYVPLEQGLNANLSIELDGDITDTVFPMLHYDTGETGTYEFGTVEGADGPVMWDDAPVAVSFEPDDA